ncbi:MAG: ABC transporter ATP-binding protein [Caulobacteraceae bacterium]
MTRAPVLTVSNLRKVYGDFVAVEGVSFAVHPGEIVGLVGPNGAGKTTTISMILGILQPSSGDVRIDGVDLARHRAKALAHTNFGTAYAPLPGNLTVEQNLRVFGLIYGVKDLSARIEQLLADYELLEHRKTKAGLLSSGEQTRVTLAKAMLNHPKLLLLDEPTASIDPATARDIRSRIVASAEADGCGVLWTSHNMYEVSEVCDRVMFLSRGRILMDGEPDALVREHGAATLEDLFVEVAHETLANGGRAP